MNSATLVDVQGTYDVGVTTQVNGVFEFNGADTAFTATGAYNGGGFFQGTGIFAVRTGFTTIGGNIEGMVPANVLKKLKKKFQQAYQSSST